jgi:hypothetical protein
MSQLGFVARPMSRASIRGVADVVRSVTNCGNEMVDIVRLIEVTMPEWDPDFSFIVSSREELGENHALTHVRDRIVEVRADIYDGACGGFGRDRMTLGHELGHLILHQEIHLARRMSEEPLKPYVDPEWQATVFAAELLMPFQTYRAMKNPEDAANVFGISELAVQTQVRAWMREGLL